MISENSLSVRFWGVRGSIACPGPDTLRYGGNTPCVEVRCGDDILIFDGGTGLRALGNALIKRGSVDVDIFFTHCHIDHVSGLPFFAPFFAGGHRVRLWAGNLLPKYTIEEVVRKMMSAPLFPIEVETFKAEIEYSDFHAGETLFPHQRVTLRTLPLDHPDGATGYRIEFAGRAIAYVTDTEVRSREIERNIVTLAQSADLMIYDCTYTDEEIVSRAGWGHSTWREGMRLADAAGARRFCLFHHDPSHDDAFMDRIAAAAVAARRDTVVAKEGLIVSL
jgi:phosphoribosyl 1,2-cyclic phosphodiesterase